MQAVQSKALKYTGADMTRLAGLVGGFVDAQLAMQKDNLFLWAPVMMAFGVGAYFSLNVEPPLILGVLGWLICAGLCVLGYPLRERGGGGQVLFLSLCALLLVATGFVSGQVRTMRVDAPVLDKRVGPVTITARVESVEHMEGKGGSRLILSHLEIEDLPPEKTPGRVRLQLRKDEGIAVGQTIRGLALLNAPSSAVMPGGFDFRRYLYFQGIGAVGFIYQPPEILEQGRAPFWSFDALRQEISQRVFAALPDTQAGFVTALLTGQRKGIAEEDQEAMRDAGIAHILAISGLHVGIVAGFVFFCVRLGLAAFPAIALRYPIKKFAAVAGMAAAVFYMMLAGATVPTQRAVLMSGIVFLAIILDRSPISLRLVAVAAAVILLVAPESLMSASFQLSFAAVASLIWFYDVTRSWWAGFNRQAGWGRKAALYFIAIGVTTLVASIATAPFSLFHFQHVSVLGSISNFAAVPLMAFWVMPCAVLALLLMPLGLEHWALYVVGAGTAHILSVAHWCAELPWAESHMGEISFPAFALFCFACVFFMLWRGAGKVLAVPMVLLAFTIGAGHKTPDILVSSDHNLFAFRTSEDALYVSSVRKEKFARGNWERLLGFEEDTALALPYEGAGADGAPGCDAEGCRMEIKGMKVAFSRDPYAQSADCAWADILIAENPISARPCRARVIVDKFDTWRSGAYALWIGDNGAVRVQSVQDAQGRRPWTPDWPEKRK